MKLIYKWSGFVKFILSLFLQNFTKCCLEPQYTVVSPFSRSNVKLAILVTFWSCQRHKTSKGSKWVILDTVKWLRSVLVRAGTGCPLRQVTAIWGHLAVAQKEMIPAGLVDVYDVYLSYPCLSIQGSLTMGNSPHGPSEELEHIHRLGKTMAYLHLCGYCYW